MPMITRWSMVAYGKPHKLELGLRVSRSAQADRCMFRPRSVHDGPDRSARLVTGGYCLISREALGHVDVRAGDRAPVARVRNATSGARATVSAEPKARRTEDGIRVRAACEFAALARRNFWY